MAVDVKVSEWAFRRLEGGQRALVLPMEYLELMKNDGGDNFRFIEYGYEGRGTDSPVMTGRELVLVLRVITYSQPGMAAGYALVEFINLS